MLAAEGARVVLGARSADQLEAVVTLIRDAGGVASEAGVAVVPGLAAYSVSKHALVALTEVIQNGNHENGIKAWAVCPGFVETEMGHVVPGANPEHFLKVQEVVDIVRFLLRLGDNVKLGPEILVRTMRNPSQGSGGGIE